MSHGKRAFLQVMVLVAIGFRTFVGAPCCADLAAMAAMQESAVHAGHAHHDENAGHDAGHDSGAASNPCCSACGPTLPTDPALLPATAQKIALPEPTPIRSLATRPPFPAYDARGPPLLV